MRKDMDRVIITSGRIGSGYSRYSRAHRRSHWEDLPMKEGMRRPHLMGYNEKSQSDYLTPLCGFLRKHVGRPWNDVWSEVCQFDSRGHVTNHVRFHTEQFVDRLVEHDGELWAYAIGGFYDRLSRWDPTSSFEQFYVDLKGILRVTIPTKRYPRKKKRLTKIALGDGSELRLYDGLWYRVVEEEIEIGPGLVSRFTGMRSPPITYKKMVTKDLLSKKLLKFHGLKNMTIQYRDAV